MKKHLSPNNVWYILMEEEKQKKKGIKIQTHSKQVYLSNLVPCGLWEIFLHTDKTIQKLKKKVKEKFLLFFLKKKKEKKKVKDWFLSIPADTQLIKIYLKAQQRFNIT